MSLYMRTRDGLWNMYFIDWHYNFAKFKIMPFYSKAMVLLIFGFEKWYYKINNKTFREMKLPDFWKFPFDGLIRVKFAIFGIKSIYPTFCVMPFKQMIWIISNNRIFFTEMTRNFFWQNHSYLFWKMYWFCSNCQRFIHCSWWKFNFRAFVESCRLHVESCRCVHNLHRGSVTVFNGFLRLVYLLISMYPLHGELNGATEVVFILMLFKFKYCF